MRDGVNTHAQTVFEGVPLRSLLVKQVVVVINRKIFVLTQPFLLFIPSWTVSVGTLMCNSVSTIEKKKKNDIKKWAQKAWMKTQRGNHLQASVLRSPLINARWLRNTSRLSVFYPEFLITA